LFNEPNQGLVDAFIAKYDQDGNKLWHKLLASSNSDYIRAMAIDSFGNIYVGGNSSVSLFGETTQDSLDAFIAKYDQDGNILWHKWLASNTWKTTMNLETDSVGNLYSSYENPSHNVNLVKYDQDGKKLWYKPGVDYSEDAYYALAVDIEDNIYVSGSTGTPISDEPLGRQDAFIVKYDQDGNKLWHQQLISANVTACSWIWYRSRSTPRRCLLIMPAMFI